MNTAPRITPAKQAALRAKAVQHRDAARREREFAAANDAEADRLMAMARVAGAADVLPGPGPVVPPRDFEEAVVHARPRPDTGTQPLPRDRRWWAERAGELAVLLVIAAGAILLAWGLA